MYLFHDFELSEEEFSLTRSGKRISMEPRALRVLLVLVGNAGKLLDKKVLLESVWRDTFVEESTLTRAIAVIRKQLEDDPRDPIFIETVPTRGYRFIAPVTIQRMPEALAAPGEVAALPLPSDASVSTDKGQSASPSVPESIQSTPAGRSADRPSGRGGKLLLASAVAVCLVASALGAFFMRRNQRASSVSTKDTLVFTDFSNTSGDPVFDDALRQGMLVQLEQSPVLRLASDRQIKETLKLMGLRADAPLTAELGREVCQRIGGTVVLDGSLSRLGNAYAIGLRARRCSTGEDLDAEQVQIARKEDALQALSRIATQFRTRIGEASATIRDLDTPLAEATTSSLDALKAFSQGIRAFNAKGSAAAVPMFQRATELDPDFAEAHVWLGRMYADVGQDTLSVQSTQRAHELRERASERERFSIDVSYDLLVTGDLEKARVACDAWVQMYPRDVYPRAFLSGVILPAFGQYEKALEEAKETIAIDPDFVIGYRNAATHLINLNRLSEAEQVLREASKRKLFLPSFVTDRYRIAFLRGDSDGMKQAAAAAPANPWLLYYQAATFARAGQLTQSRALQEMALRSARHGARQDLEAQLLVAAASTGALYGYGEDAAAQARTALRLSRGRNVESSAALVLAMAGKSGEAMSLVNDLNRRFKDDTLIRYNYVPSIQAAVALTKKQPRQALELLQETSQFGLSVPLYPIYLRGQSYLALGQPTEAAAEFQRIIDHPGLVMNDPLFNLSQIKLGSAYAMAGEPDHARSMYEAVQQRWAGADPGFPALQRLKRKASELSH